MSAPELLPPFEFLKNPELRHYNEQVDVWTLGCIVFNMITGVPPFVELI